MEGMIKLRTQMGNKIIISIFSIGILIFSICSCSKLSDIELSDIFVSEKEINKMLINYAVNSKIYVSKEGSPNHPASSLNNGITSSENWNKGEGWEAHFDGRFSYGQYADYGEEWRWAQYEAERQALSQGREPRNVRVNPNGFTEDDYRWRGLRSSFANYAMGWVVLELPEPKRINRVIVYTVDSEMMPAEKYGVRDVAVQYWAMRAQSWQNVKRYDKKIGQKDDSITGNEEKKISFRFEPVETDKVRVVIRWTNDAEKEKIGFSDRLHVTGNVRLTELEIYGFEKKPELDENAELKELLGETGETKDTPEKDAEVSPELEELLEE